MKKLKSEKRVINIPKEDFDVIRNYCDEKSLDMVKWMTQIALEKVIQKIPTDRLLTSKDIVDIQKKRDRVSLPDNWLELVLEEINKDLIWTVNAMDENRGRWNGVLSIKNIFGFMRPVALNEYQIALVAKKLSELGFTLSINPDSTSVWKYNITWEK